MTLSPYWHQPAKPIPALEREWVEGLLAAMALAPDTRDDYTNQPVGMAIRPYVPENHTLVCGDCRQPWHRVESETSWYGRCAACNSANLIVESEPIPGALPHPTEWHLQCQICEATWVGIPGASCWWCERSIEIQFEHQAELLLTPPDIHPDDARYLARMDAWSDRLVVGEAVGLITQAQSDAAWKRATNRSKAT
jgi:hypothetical protein